MSEKQKRVGEVAAAAKERIGAKLGDIWWAILLRGLLALGLAVCAFVWPEKTLGLFVKLLGAYFLIDGVIAAVGAYRGGDHIRRDLHRFSSQMSISRCRLDLRLAKQLSDHRQALA